MIKQRNNKGFTLVELMISMALGIIVTSVCLQFFLTFKQIYVSGQALARIQENARIMSILLGSAIQSSGNISCNAFREDISFCVPSGIDRNHFGLYPDQRIRGISLQILKNDPHAYHLLSNRISTDSDILWIKAIKRNSPLVNTSLKENASIWVKEGLTLKKDQIICLSDCSHADFLKVKEAVKTSESTKMTSIKIVPVALSKQYGRGANVGILSSTFFYIGKTKRTNLNGYPIMALYSTDLNGRTLELIEGVQHFEVKYGVKVEEEIVYLTYHQVPAWEEVISVQVSALLTSIEDGLSKPKSYRFRDKEIMPTDRLMRMWWTFEWAIKGLG